MSVAGHTAAIGAANMVWIWEDQAWPSRYWDEAGLSRRLADVRHRQGVLLGRMQTLGFELREEAVLRTLTQDVLKTSEIEGERFDAVQVRSSLARRLGLDAGALRPVDRDVEGIVEVMLDATRNYETPLTEERLFGWHAALFPTGHSGLSRIRVGVWRDDATGPMQVISGPVGRERMHFTAPPARHLRTETAAFLAWFNSAPDADPILKAALAHLRFVTIHPFDDGNGRIARAIADMALARAERSPQRFYSMSAQIRTERADYYDALECCQRGGLDVTAWVDWFLGCLGRAIDGADGTLSAVLRKAEFWRRHAQASLNERQTRVLNRVLDGFEGKLTSSKWARLAKCSQDTAGRDIADLVERKILRKGEAGGRSTHYELVPEGAVSMP